MAKTTVQFTAQTKEYTLLWLKSALLSILTLGIYLPWAIIAIRKYLANHTIIQDKSFDYHAKPSEFIPLLFCLAAFFLSCYMVDQTYINEPKLTILWLVIVFFLFFPILQTEYTQLKIKMLSFSCVRFNFTGQILTAYWLLTFKVLLFFAAILVTFKILMSFDQNNLSWLLSYIEIIPSSFYHVVLYAAIVLIIIQAITWGILLSGITTFKMNHIFLGQHPVHFSFKHRTQFCYSAVSYVLFFFLFAVTWNLTNDILPFQFIIFPPWFYNYYTTSYVIYFFSIVLISIPISVTYYQFRMHQNLSKGFSFLNLTAESTLKALPLLWINVSNYLMIAATLGLAIPVAQIRSRRYFAENTHIMGEIDLQAIAQLNTQNT